MEGESQQQIKYRISIVLGLVLVLIAGVFDLVEIILDLVGVGIAGYIKDFAQIIFFPSIFLVLKAPFWKGKKATKKIVATITYTLVSFIPGISTILPEVTIGVFMTVYYTRKEDAEARLDPETARRGKRNITRFKRVREKAGKKRIP